MCKVSTAGVYELYRTPMKGKCLFNVHSWSGGDVWICSGFGGLLSAVNTRQV